MPAEIYLVKVGMTMSEGVVEEWYVPDGGQVKKGELLYRLETEKVNLDVDAESDGTVKHLVPVGVTKEPGDVVGYIFAPGEEVVMPGNDTSAPSGDTEVARAAAAPAARGASAVVHELPTADAQARVFASPAARRLARELGVDYRTVPGTGPGGRVVEHDIRTALAAEKGRPRPSPLAARVAGQRGVDLGAVTGTGPGGRVMHDDVKGALAAGPKPGEQIPVRGMRKVIAERMYQSLQSSAQLTMDMDAAMDDAVRLRAQLIDEWQPEGVRPTYNDLVVRAVAKALRAHPLMNATFTGDNIDLIERVDVGIAVAVPDGLLVPVIREADRLSLKDIAIESARLARAARAGTLGVDDYAGGTFTVTALGMFGVDAFTPIINQPQAGILGVNRLRDGVGWSGDTPVRRQAMRLSLTWDHRVLDGAPAAEFLASVRDLLQAPFRLLV